MKKLSFLLAPIFTAITAVALADALPINPGLWEIESTSTNPMTGQQETETETECIVESEYDPATMMEDQEGCQMNDSNLDGDTLTFSMSCEIQGGQMTMNGVYESDGDSAQGTTTMQMSFGQQNMTSEGTWTANRIGDC